MSESAPGASPSGASRWPRRPVLGTRFFKAHGLGNDYLVFEEGDDWLATPERVAQVCERHRGVGSDGLVAVLRDRGDGLHRLRMFNPDGGEFERSGNGLRIAGAYLARRGDRPPFRVSVGGDEVLVRLHEATDALLDVSVEMGRARTGPEAVELDPAALDADGRLAGPDGRPLAIVPVSVGNPHVVVVGAVPTQERLATIGPWLVRHPALAHGANVQLAEPVDDDACRALIWERGVGRTSASGTSACAVAVALVSTGRLRAGWVRVDMPGGAMSVCVEPDLEVVLRGPVEPVCEGVLAGEA